MVVRRYIFNAGTIELLVAGEPLKRELWIGVEIESPQEIDLRLFSEALGFHLIPASGLSPAHLASIDVLGFERVTLDGSMVRRLP